MDSWFSPAWRYVCEDRGLANAAKRLLSNLFQLSMLVPYLIKDCAVWLSVEALSDLPIDQCVRQQPRS